MTEREKLRATERAKRERTFSAGREFWGLLRWFNHGVPLLEHADLCNQPHEGNEAKRYFRDF